jgi:glycosyltransferase involved in cell wall biosynthesis
MKLSVITVCKNSEQTISQCIRSVIGQSYGDIEYIIIDGLSTDRTLSIIEQYRNNIDVLISESDYGIYNAMNKGIKYSTGNLVYFLNSDDILHDNDVFLDIVTAFTLNINSKIIFGNVIMTDNNGDILIKYDKIDKNYFYKHTVCHQALFAKKELFDTIGLFNEKYKIHADVDWLMRVYFAIGDEFEYIDRTICYFSGHGFCSNPINAEQYKFDRQEISAKYFFKARYRLFLKKLLMRLGAHFVL